MALTYSLILPTCNRAELVSGFLRSVEKQTVLPEEVIVVDQSDDSSTRDAFNRWMAPEGKIRKKYIYSEIKSLILARHTGLDACGQTDLVVFFDDDILLDPLFCEEAIKVFEADKECRYAGGMGTVDGWPNRKKFFQAFFLMPHEGHGKFLASGAQTFVHWKKEFAETEFLSGGCTFWRRDIIQKYRFDERLSGYGHGDDVDISYRISRDYKLFFQPKSVCFQVENPPGRVFQRKYRRVYLQNMYYLARKNRFSLWAFAWFAVGHVLRDLICLEFSRLYGDLEGIWNILRNKIDTVIGYEEFQRNRKKERKHGASEIRV